MAKKSVVEASAELFNLLKPFNSADRMKIVRATLELLGDGQSKIKERNQKDDSGSTGESQEREEGITGQTQADFFESKETNKKQEELAVAARYLEINNGLGSVKRADMTAFFKAARINFNPTNFARDIDNARAAGLFNSGGNSNAGYALSLYGQKFVDALPDRDKAEKLNKPNVKRPKKGKVKGSG